MSPFDDFTSDMSDEMTSGNLVEQLGGSADPVDRAVAELFRSAREIFGSGPVPEIGRELARFVGATTAVPSGATAGPRVPWLTKAAAKVLIGLALVTGSLTTAYASGVVDFGSLFDDNHVDVSVPVSEPLAPPTSVPSANGSIDPESVVPGTTQGEEGEGTTEVPSSSDGAGPSEPDEVEKPDVAQEPESDAGATQDSMLPEAHPDAAAEPDETP